MTGDLKLNTLQKSKTRGILYAILSGLCYGLLGYFGINILKSGSSVYNMIFWRFAAASLFIAMILPFTSVWTKVSSKQLLKIVFIAGGMYFLESITYFISGQIIGTGLAMVIFFIYPAIVVLINLLFYHQKVNKNYYFAIGVILGGMVFVADIGSLNLDLYGIGLAILSAFLYAIYIVISKNNPLSPMLSTFAVSVGCMIASLVAALAGNSFFVPNDLATWIDISGIGIICTAVPMLLLLKSMNYISSEQASIFSVSEPFFTMVFGMLLLGEVISLKQALGIVLLLSGALVTLLPNKVKETA